MNITSINNEKVKYWSSLSVKKIRDNEKKFIIEGDHLVDIAISLGLVIDLITTDINKYPDAYVVTDEIMRKLSNQVTPSNVCAVINYLSSSIEEGNAIVLDSLQDPGNLGTIIRSAVAFGFKNIILGKNTVDIYNDKVLRSTEGMIFYVNIMKIDLINNIDSLKEMGYTIVGASLDANNSIKDVKDKKLALIIGNEGAGMNEFIKCDYYVKINMDSKCESLNAGVSASILMNEVYND